nr:glycoside hydrolase family 3 C-terminal domain-containing protein [uncultured Tolumonas sp.]
MMKHSKKINLSGVAIAVSVAIAGIISGCNNDNSSPSVTVKDNAYYKSMAEALVAKMTTDEKLNMLVGPGMTNENVTNLKSDTSGVAGYINGVLNTTSGLDIPASKLADGPAGIRISSTREGDAGTYYATGFPVGTLLASTWNPEIVKEVGAAAGNEAKEYGVDFWLAPGMNIQRNPLNGRNFEYYSEDPLVTGSMAAAMVSGAQSEGIATTIKHFAANNSETNRMNVNNIISPRALREIYLRGFELAVENAQPWALMTSYNKINGTYTGQRADLVTNILRDEWGYQGLVMSDWFAGDNALAQVTAGNDLIQPGATNFVTQEVPLEVLKSAYSNKQLSDDIINRDAVHILTQALKTPTNQKYVYSNNPDLNAHARLAKAAAEEGMVLLKNDHSVSTAALPINTTNSVAAFGIAQLTTRKGGTGSGDVNTAYIKNIIDGLSGQFTVDSDLRTAYSDWYSSNRTQLWDAFHMNYTWACAEPTLTDAQINTAAANDNVAVISISRIAGEGADRTNAKGDYQLTDDESNLITRVSTAFHGQNKKVVVVLNVGGTIDTSAWESNVDSILLAYMPGQEAGDAIADLLSGVTNPSGKLAQTIAKNYTDISSATSFSGVDTNSDGTVDTNYYNDDIYVGYRYFNTFKSDAVDYPFGFGLSYTTFGIEGAAVSSNTLDKGANGSVTLTATVSNTGNVAGKEVAQVYINAPEVKLKKPIIELKAFDKTDKLEAGASQTVNFTIPTKLLASFDPDTNQWIVEPGTYKAYVSNSSDVSGVTPVTFSVSKEIVVSNTTPGALALPTGVSTSDFVTNFAAN